MIEFKKRLRLLAEYDGVGMEYLDDGGIRFTKEEGVLQFNPKSKRFLACSVIDKTQCLRFDIQKEFVFDVYLRFSKMGFTDSLKNYEPGPLLTLQDYINEEQGSRCIEALRSKLKKGHVSNESLGGNRILVEYRSGLLIIVDDLMNAAANVVEFN